MGQGSLSGTLWAFLLLNSCVRVRGVEVEEMEHCESASFVLESKELMRMNLSTCFTQISWDKVQLLKVKRQIRTNEWKLEMLQRKDDRNVPLTEDLVIPLALSDSIGAISGCIGHSFQVELKSNDGMSEKVLVDYTLDWSKVESLIQSESIEVCKKRGGAENVVQIGKFLDTLVGRGNFYLFTM